MFCRDEGLGQSMQRIILDWRNTYDPSKIGKQDPFDSPCADPGLFVGWHWEQTLPLLSNLSSLEVVFSRKNKPQRSKRHYFLDCQCEAEETLWELFWERLNFCHPGLCCTCCVLPELRIRILRNGKDTRTWTGLCDARDRRKARVMPVLSKEMRMMGLTEPSEGRRFRAGNRFYQTASSNRNSKGVWDFEKAEVERAERLRSMALVGPVTFTLADGDRAPGTNDL
jgi:hypothetical protein